MAKRRYNNEGTVSYDKNKKYWRGSMRSEGIRHHVYAKTKAEVQQKLKALARLEEAGADLLSSSMSLGKYMKEWLALKKASIRQNTYDNYETLIRTHLVPILGHIKLKKITPERINKAWLRMSSDGYSATLIEHLHVLLLTALKDAVKKHLIIANPSEHVTKPRVERDEIRPLTDSEVGIVLDTLTNTEYYDVVFIALHTGMRRNELLALKWNDINLDMASVSVNRSIYRAHTTTVTTPPKTRSGSRSIDLAPDAVIHLRDMFNKQLANGLMYGYKPNGDSSVFIRTTGEALLPTGLTHGFKKTLRYIADTNPEYDVLRHAKFHDLRHTHASDLYEQGVPDKVISERLGHSRVSITMDIYTHIKPTMQKNYIKTYTLKGTKTKA